MKDKEIRILVVDDDLSACLSLAEILRLQAYEVTMAVGGPAALSELATQSFDIVITDLKMPEVDGLDVLTKIRQKYPRTLVILLTAYATLETAVQALRQGAFDYLVKPANPDDIFASIQRAVETLAENTRRQNLLDQMEQTLQALRQPATSPQPDSAPATSAQTMSRAGILLDLSKREAYLSGEQLNLTPTEFEILALLMSNPERPFSAEEIWEQIKGFSPSPESTQGAVRVYVSRLRQKLETNPKEPRFLVTVRGYGYRFAG